MPVSEVNNISPIMCEVARLNPIGVLDLGIGFGKMGALCREVLDATHGRCQPHEWQAKIVGVEGFEHYRNPCWDLYDQVYVENILQHYEVAKGWPLVLILDVLEHFDKLEAKVILDTLVANNSRVIVSVPVGECPQDACFGNELERHRSTWTKRDFIGYDYYTLHEGVCLVTSIKGEV